MEKKIIQTLQKSTRGFTAKGIFRRMTLKEKDRDIFGISLRSLILSQKVIWTINHRFKLNEDL